MISLVRALVVMRREIRPTPQGRHDSPEASIYSPFGRVGVRKDRVGLPGSVCLNGDASDIGVAARANPFG
jgi:hypothetical protein